MSNSANKLGRKVLIILPTLLVGILIIGVSIKQFDSNKSIHKVDVYESSSQDIMFSEAVEKLSTVLGTYSESLETTRAKWEERESAQSKAARELTTAAEEMKESYYRYLREERKWNIEESGVEVGRHYQALLEVFGLPSTLELRLGGVCPAIDALWEIMGKQTAEDVKVEIALVIANLKKHLLELNIRDLQLLRALGKIYQNPEDAVRVVEWNDEYWFDGNEYVQELKVWLMAPGQYKGETLVFELVISPSMDPINCTKLEGNIRVGRGEPIELSGLAFPLSGPYSGSNVLCMAKLKINKVDFDASTLATVKMVLGAKQKSPYSFYGELVPHSPIPFEKMNVSLHFLECPETYWEGKFNQKTGIVTWLNDLSGEEAKYAFLKRTGSEDWRTVDSLNSPQEREQCILQFSGNNVDHSSIPMVGFLPHL